jgi:DNA polymerase-1
MLATRITTEIGSPVSRNAAKTVVFGQFYGRGPESLAKQLRISDSLAKKLVASLDNLYPTFMAWKKSHTSKCFDQGYIDTYGGFKRYLQHDHYALLDFAMNGLIPSLSFDRDAVNTTIQGTGADICKSAMIKVFFALLEKNLYPQVRIVHQIHDEIIIEIPDYLVNDLDFIR